MSEDEIALRKANHSRIIIRWILLLFLIIIFVIISLYTLNWFIILLAVVLGVGLISPMKSRHVDDPDEDRKDAEATSWRTYFSGLTGI